MPPRMATVELQMGVRRGNLSRRIHAGLLLSAGLAAISVALAEDISPAPAQLTEIVVSARKRLESALDVPVSITSFSEQSLESFHIQQFTDYADKVANLSYTAGAGSYGLSDGRSVAIRGVGGRLDNSTTGFYIDDTPVSDSMDPRIVDIQRVEVLKGPQGTLYGSGSMGGNIKLVTNRPDLNREQYRYSGEFSYTRYARANYSVNGVANIPLVSDRSAIRLLGFYSQESGFMTRRWPAGTDPAPTAAPWDAAPAQLHSATAGGDTALGASVTWATRVTDELNLTLRLMYQRQYYDGWPTPYAPLPAFRVASFVDNRTSDVPERSSNTWSLPAIEVDYKADHWNLASSTSYFDRKAADSENGTEGTSQLFSAYFNLPLRPGTSNVWSKNNTTRRFVNETRVSFDERRPLSGVVGVYFADEKLGSVWPDANYPGLAAAGLFTSDSLYFLDYPTHRRELAEFAEVYVKLPGGLTATLGARHFNITDEATTLEQDGFFAGGPIQQTIGKSSQSGFSPKASLIYKFSETASVYATAAKGYRPGGPAARLPNLCDSELAGLGLTPEDAMKFKSDSLWNYEIGAKAEMQDKRLLLAAAAFQINWSGIQQTVNLQCGFPFTTNAGAARIRGAEFEVAGKPVDRLFVRISAGYLDGKVTDQGIGVLSVGRRLDQTPKFTGSAGATYSWPLRNGASGFASADYSYVGEQLSGTSSVTDPLIRPAYQLINARLGLSYERYEVALFAQNLGNTRANLGDINTLAFRRYYQDLPVNRVVVSRPATIGLQFNKTF